MTNPNQISSEKERAIIKLYKEGYTYQKNIRELRVGKNTITRCLKRNNSIDNLQLLYVGKHLKGQHFICCDCGSPNVKPIEL